MGLRVAIAIAAAAAAAVIAVIAAPAPSSSPSPRAPTAAAASPAATIRSRAARIAPGRRETVLRVRSVGRFVVACTRDSQAAVAFVADRLLPSADVVVSRPRGVRARFLHPQRRWAPWPAAARVAETWQIAPFAAARVRVVVVHVAARRVPDVGCAASALALIGPDQGPTG